MHLAAPERPALRKMSKNKSNQNAKATKPTTRQMEKEKLDNFTAPTAATKSTAETKCAAARGKEGKDMRGGRRERPLGADGDDAFLLRAQYKPDTVKRYLSGIEPFLAWVTTKEKKLEPWCEFDRALCGYYHHLYRQGNGRHVAVNLRGGLVMLLPRLRDETKVSDGALRGWAKLVPSVSFAPLSRPLVHAIAATLARGGHGHYATAVLLAFDCWLRIGETMRLRRSDVAEGADHRLGNPWPGRMVLRIRVAKTGFNQSVEVKDIAVQALLRERVSQLKDGEDELFPGGCVPYRRAFKRACHALGLGNEYVPHSLRHGGATHAYMAGVGIEDIMVRGRWAANKSARRYIQQGKALLLTSRAPLATVQLGHTLGQDITIALNMAKGLHTTTCKKRARSEDGRN
jgi:integrase